MIEEADAVDEEQQVTEERRKFPRIKLETRVDMASDSNFYVGFSEDVSQGGVFVATYSLQPIGTLVALSFSLPSGYNVNAKGRVRWIRDLVDFDDRSSPGIGIGFEELSLEDKQVIEQFMHGRSPIFFADD
jgi:uncharacterized protein (TIGR02266 family)